MAASFYIIFSLLFIIQPFIGLHMILATEKSKVKVKISLLQAMEAHRVARG
jgi:hypothetical protein